MRALFALLIPLIAAVAQASLAGYMSFAEVRPDLLALVVVSWSIVAGAAEGVWWAFIGGLFGDLLGGDLLGAGTFGALTVSLLPVALVFGLRGSESGPVGVVAGAALAGLGAALHEGLYTIVLLLIGASLPALPVLAALLLGGAVYTGVLALGAYPVLRGVHRRTAARPAFEW